jgi:uncharacterized protein YndB with AHSA1/START domain
MKTLTDIVRTTEISAPRDVVFRYFTDSERFARWWGAGSTVDPRPGGAIRICNPGGVVAAGQFQELVPPERVVFSYGYEGNAHGIAPGTTTVTVTLDEIPAGTRVTLRHAGLPTEEAILEHTQGWRYQLSVFSKTVTAEHFAGSAKVADQWFAAWAETDGAKRRALLKACATPDISFHDSYSALHGYEDLDAHVAATQRFMPGMGAVRAGEPVLSHGDALVRWEIRDPKGGVKGRGANAVSFAPDGRLRRVVGFWEA